MGTYVRGAWNRLRIRKGLSEKVVFRPRPKESVRGRDGVHRERKKRSSGETSRGEGVGQERTPHSRTHKQWGGRARDVPGKAGPCKPWNEIPAGSQEWRITATWERDHESTGYVLGVGLGALDSSRGDYINRKKERKMAWPGERAVQMEKTGWFKRRL